MSTTTGGAGDLAQAGTRTGLIRRGAIKAAIGLIVAAPLLLAERADAQDKIRVGIIAHLSGPFAAVGGYYRQGVETYVALHGKTAGDREVEVMWRDVGSPDPASAKRQAEEFIVRDKVSILGGFYITPEALGVAQVVTETSTPTVLFGAGTTTVPKLSPFFVRVGPNGYTHAHTQAEWVLKKGFKRVYIAVADYAAGHDTQAVSKARLLEGGATVIGEDRMPLNTIDYAPFAERIANAKPDAVVIFIPNGAPAVRFFKAYAAAGMQGKAAAIGVAETDDSELASLDDSVIGAYSTIYYSADQDTPANKVFKEGLAKNFPSAVPSWGVVGGYDGMHVIYSMIASQKGKPFNGPDAVKGVLGMKWDSPRGPLTIDPTLREVLQNIYVRRVEKKDGKLVNVTTDIFPQVPLLR